jgi:hypothetical protein
LKTDTGRGSRQERRNSGLLRLVVLVPHRDSSRFLEARRSSLFAAGLLGAWSFPIAAPLARLSRPLTAGELKALAAYLREASLAGGRDGRIAAGEAAEVQCPGGTEGPLRFWGPSLNLPVPAWEDICAPAPASDPVYRPFPAAVLCAALTPGGLSPSPPLPALPAFSFRAAAAANMAIRPLAQGAAGYSFRWRIGPLFWLPKKNRLYPRRAPAFIANTGQGHCGANNPPGGNLSGHETAQGIEAE